MYQGKGLVIGEIKLLPLPAGRGWNVGGGVRALRDQGSSRRRTSFGDKAPHVTKSSPLPAPTLSPASQTLPNRKGPDPVRGVLGLSSGT